MIKKGTYTIYSVLNISVSLRDLKLAPKESLKSGIHKVVLFNNVPVIAYFIDGIDFGEDSIIEIKHDIDADLLRSYDYKIVRCTVYDVNYKLIDKLISVKRVAESK